MVSHMSLGPRYNQHVIAPGAQAERRVDAGPVRDLLGGESSPAALLFLFAVRPFVGLRGRPPAPRRSPSGQGFSGSGVAFAGHCFSCYFVPTDFTISRRAIPKRSCSVRTKIMPSEIAGVARQASPIWFTANSSNLGPALTTRMEPSSPAR